MSALSHRNLLLLTASLVAAAAALLYRPISLRLHVLGAIGRNNSVAAIYDAIQPVRRIPGTPFTEDLHLHEPSGLIFGASEAEGPQRRLFFPPIGRFGVREEDLGQGTIVVIDPKTFSAQRLALENFHGPFVTHGIDIYSAPEDPDTVYIVAVNHLPNPDYHLRRSSIFRQAPPKARSRLELFRHRIGSTTATHVRSIWHPLLRTPNDVLIASPTDIYVTNDHFFRQGPARLFEDVTWVPWTDLVHLEIHPPLDRQAAMGDKGDADSDALGVVGNVAHRGWYSNNGLGHGRDATKILIGCAVAGELIIANISAAPLHVLSAVEKVQLPMTVDNPTLFTDPFAQETGRDAGGYVLAGMSRAGWFPNGVDSGAGKGGEGRNPSVVWLLDKRREKRLIFQDDGRVLSSASTALLVAIDPDENDGRKQAWLFVTGPLSEAVVVARVDL